MGGSFIPHGGQNPLEPARLGYYVIHGPHIKNFKEVYKFLNKLFVKHDSPSPIIVNATMNKIPNVKLFKNIDFAWASGTLHHSESIDSAIQQVCKFLKKNGLFMFWIINEQKPVR